MNRDWSFTTRRGNGGAEVRIPNVGPGGRPGSTPCSVCPKIPKGQEPKPRNAVELSERNQDAYAHYLECKAIGQFPDDAIVRRNAGLIRQVEDEHFAYRIGEPSERLARLMIRSSMKQQ